jgi:hypothetical protein
MAAMLPNFNEEFHGLGLEVVMALSKGSIRIGAIE